MSCQQTVYKIGPFSLLLVGLTMACGGSDDSSSMRDADESTGGTSGVPTGGVGGAMEEPEPSEDEDKWAPIPECPESTHGFATEVVDHSFGEGQDFGQDEFPEMVLGGPHGGGCCAGSLHVTSLGDGGFVTLAFGERAIVDGDGADFIVFENPFWVSGDPEVPVAELGQVSVSVDGEEWFDFPCEPGEDPPFGNCAGWRPVEASVIVGKGTDPFDPETSGGAPYDLADVGLEEARFVRVTDVAGDDAVFDLDAVSIVNGICE